MNTPDDSEGIDAEIEIDKEPNGFSYRTALLSEPKIEDSPPREKESVAELAEPDRVVRRKWKKYTTPLRSNFSRITNSPLFDPENS